ncbi:MAG: hypothetical protein ACLVEU_14730 [Bacteroides cellulosilyticus]
MWQKTFLDHFMGSISTDGYTVYRMYDGEGSKVLHVGCWYAPAGGCGLMLAIRQDGDGHNRFYR